MKYTEKQRIDMTVRFTACIEWERPAFGYGYETVSLNKFKDEDGNTLVWKTTTGTIHKEYVDEEGVCKYIFPEEKSLLHIKATVKSIGEYNGEEQVELTRVKLVDVVEMAKTAEQVRQERKEAQLASIDEQAGDFVWKMPYRQYKEHYADCETIAGSYDSGMRGHHKVDDATIEVIIRAGRLKNSGVRNKSFSEYIFKNEENEVVRYKAVSYENAARRANREHPDSTWEFVHEVR